MPGLPSNFARNPYDADVIDYEQTLNYSAYPTRHYSPDDWRRYRSLYFRLVEKVDAEIGKIVDAIDKQDLWKNTVVILQAIMVMVWVRIIGTRNRLYMKR